MYSGITAALRREGYQERRDLFGAPYDFRMAADGLEQVALASRLPRGQRQAAAGADAARVHDRPSCRPISHQLFAVQLKSLWRMKG